MRLGERVRANRDLILLAAIVAAGAAARFLTLGLQSFDSGETVTVSRILHPSYTATLTAVASIERSGPLYYSLAWVWAHLFGTAEAAIRSLSALFGTATIVVAYLAAREVFSKRAALIAAALVAASPDLFWYSQEARSYPLFILLTTASLYFFVRSLRRPSAGSYAGWAIVSSLALATHYFSVFSIAPEALWLVLASRRRPARPLVATGAVGLSGLALLPLAIQQEGAGRANGFTSIPLVQRAGSALVKFAMGEGESTSGKWAATPPLARGLGLLALAGFAVAMAGVLARGDDEERRGAYAVGGIAAASFAIPVAAAYAGFDFIEPRNLLGSLVPLLVVVAAGADVWLRQLLRAGGWLRVAAPLAVAVPFAAFILLTETTPALQRDNWRGLSEAVADSGRAGLVLTDPPAAGKPLNYYLHRVLPRLGRTKYPCGIRTRRIVTITRGKPEAAKGPYRLASERTMPQHWTVAAYVAPRAEWIDTRRLDWLDLVHGTSAEARVDQARPARAEPARGRFLIGGCPAVRNITRQPIV
jgi:hypothetical protein